MISENHLPGGKNVISNQYDFTGNVRKILSIQNDGNTETEILLEYTYDHANRLLNATHALNGASPVKLFNNEYNELGELVKKRLHVDHSGSTQAQAIDYEYNIRGWLRSINDSGLDGSLETPDPSDLFSMELLYKTTIPNLPTN